MSLDSIIHPAKGFADVSDDDVAAFLRDREFESQGLKLEFKTAFPG